MTIKPLTNQKSGEKKESHSHGHSEQSNQNIVVQQNVRSNHRNVVLNQKPNVETPSPQRRSETFEDVPRQRRSPRSPHKNNVRLKRDKRERDRDREKICSSPQYHQSHTNCNSSHSSAPKTSTLAQKNQALAAVPNGQSTATPPKDTKNLLEETFSGYNSGDEHLVPKETLLSPDEWKARDEQFLNAMSERGYVIKDIVEDGACLFRAISLQIYGDQEMHEVIRQQTMDYIFQNREYFAHFVTEDINSYVKRKRNKESHGNHIEIQAMSEIYNRPVELYCYKTTPTNIFNSEQMNNGYDPLRLSYQRGSHYNAILDPYNASVGVGLGLAGYKPESQTREAIRLSEQLEIEKTMFEDKLNTTDWEATNEAIEEQIARESYLQWCRENMQTKDQQKTKNLLSTTTTCGSTSYGSETFNDGFNNASIGSCSGTSSNSTVTSGESSSHGCSSSYMNCTNNIGIGSKDSACIKYNNNNFTTNSNTNNDSIKDQQIPPSNPNIDNINKNKSNDCCDSDDDRNSTSSTEIQYRDKLSRHKTAKSCSSTSGGSSGGNLSPNNIRRGKKRRLENDVFNYTAPTTSSSLGPRDNNISSGSLSSVHAPSSTSPAKTNVKDSGHTELINLMSTSAKNKIQNTMLSNPGTSKQIHQTDDKPVSRFYQSLLESSYTDDGNGQLSENEMVLKAIQMSRIDFIEEQRRKFDDTFKLQDRNYTSYSNYTNSGSNQNSRNDVGDDDSDTPSLT